jgi:hypothetical protein
MTDKGRTVESVRVEHQVGGTRETYVGFPLDAANGGVRVFAALNEMVTGVCARLGKA